MKDVAAHSRYVRFAKRAYCGTLLGRVTAIFGMTLEIVAKLAGQRNFQIPSPS